jgi:hypothetical protein
MDEPPEGAVARAARAVAKAPLYPILCGGAVCQGFGERTRANVEGAGSKWCDGGEEGARSLPTLRSRAAGAGCGLERPDARGARPLVRPPGIEMIVALAAKRAEPATVVCCPLKVSIPDEGVVGSRGCVAHGAARVLSGKPECELCHEPWHVHHGVILQLTYEARSLERGGGVLEPIKGFAEAAALHQAVVAVHRALKLRTGSHGPPHGVTASRHIDDPPVALERRIRAN